ncbi:MAG: hypothetical protein AAGI44_11525 [Pseudomonadota bacterium]
MIFFVPSKTDTACISITRPKSMIVFGLLVILALPINSHASTCFQDSGKPSGFLAGGLWEVGSFFKSRKLKGRAQRLDKQWCELKESNTLIKVLDENALVIASFTLGSAVICVEYCNITFKLIVDGAKISIPVTKAQAMSMAATVSTVVTYINDGATGKLMTDEEREKLDREVEEQEELRKRIQNEKAD